MAAVTVPATAPRVPKLPLAATGPLVVVTGWRDTDRSRWLPTLSTVWTDPSALERPVVSVPVPPGNPKVGEVLRDVLFSLGKSPHVTGGARTDDGELAIPVAWLLARHTREIILIDAPQLPWSVAQQLIEFASGVGARLWLIAHHNRTEVHDDLADDWDAACIDLDEFDRIWHRPDKPTVRRAIPGQELRRSRLPGSSALSFRADCRRTLSPRRFEQLDAIYRSQLAAARSHFTDQAREGRLNHEAVAAYLRRVLRAIRPVDDLVVATRAIEAAAIPAGYCIDVEVPVLINAAERNPRPGRYTLADAAALDVYGRPQTTAVCALAMCEVPPNTIAQLTLADVADDGSCVTTPDGPADIPADVRPLLLAQLLARRIDGGTDRDLLLTTAAGRPVRLNWISRTVKIAELETGVRLARQRYDRKRLTVFEWLTVHGLAVRSLQSGERRQGSA